MKYLINMIGKNNLGYKRVIKVNVIVALLILQALHILGQSKLSQNEFSNMHVMIQANEMGHSNLAQVSGLEMRVSVLVPTDRTAEPAHVSMLL